MIQSLLLFVFVFVVAFGAHYKVTKEELEELKANCGRAHYKNRNGTTGLTVVHVSKMKNGKKDYFAAGVVISPRHVLVHARSLFGSWNCDKMGVSKVVKNPESYLVGTKNCEQKSFLDCHPMPVNRVHFRNINGMDCKKERKWSDLHGLILLEMGKDNEIDITPMCLPPLTHVFKPFDKPMTKYSFLYTGAPNITKLETLKWIEDCGEPCASIAPMNSGEMLVYNNKEDRSFFVAYYPSREEGIPYPPNRGFGDLLMSNHAELIFNFTRIPTWNYTADFVNGEKSTTEEPTEPMSEQPTRAPTNPAPPPAAAPRTISSLPPILGVTTKRIPPPLPTEISISPGHPHPDAPRANESSTTAEFTFGDYGDYDLMDFGNPYRIRNGGVATWMMTWLFLIVCFLIVE